MKQKLLLQPAAIQCAALALSSFAASAFAQEKNPDRNAYFGETHIHTSWSVDAWLFGNRVTGPDEALKYAQGETIKHPLGYDIKIDTPMDFMGVTDHSEYVGVTKQANTPGSAVSKLRVAEKLKVRSVANIQRIYLWLGYTIVDEKPVKELIQPEVAGTIWADYPKIADKYYKPGNFTTLASYEWTSTPNNCNMLVLVICGK